MSIHEIVLTVTAEPSELEDGYLLRVAKSASVMVYQVHGEHVGILRYEARQAPDTVPDTPEALTEPASPVAGRTVSLIDTRDGAPITRKDPAVIGYAVAGRDGILHHNLPRTKDEAEQLAEEWTRDLPDGLDWDYRAVAITELPTEEAPASAPVLALPLDLPEGVESPEELGQIFDAPSRQELEMYRAHMDDHDVHEDHREEREAGFSEGWTRAYYLITQTPKEA